MRRTPGFVPPAQHCSRSRVHDDHALPTRRRGDGLPGPDAVRWRVGVPAGEAGRPGRAAAGRPGGRLGRTRPTALPGVGARPARPPARLARSAAAAIRRRLPTRRRRQDPVPRLVAADGVAAFDAETGDALWRFFTDGPVRFAPAVWEDGLLRLRRRLALLPRPPTAASWSGSSAAARPTARSWATAGSSRPGRLAARRSSCRRTASAVVYFARRHLAVHGRLPPRPRRPHRRRRLDQRRRRLALHQAAAQGRCLRRRRPAGPLAVVGDRLLVPGGRSIPACYDRRTGKLLHFRLADDSKLGGGAEVAAGPNFFVNGGGAFDLATGTYLGAVGDHAVLAGDVLFTATPTELRGLRRVSGRLAPAGPQGAEAPRLAASVPLPGIEALTADGLRASTSAPSARSWPSTCRWRRAGRESPGRRRSRAGRFTCWPPTADCSCPRARAASTASAPTGGEILKHPLPPVPEPPAEDGWTDAAHEILADSRAPRRLLRRLGRRLRPARRGAGPPEPAPRDRRRAGRRAGARPSGTTCATPGCTASAWR